MYTIKSVKENLTTLAKVRKSNEALDLQLHDIAMNALYYANNPMIQDVTVAQNLVDALGRSHRRETLLAWFKHFGKITTTKVDGKTMVKFSKKGKDAEYSYEFINANFDQVMVLADKTPFYDKVEKEEEADAFVDYDIKAALANLVKRAEKLESTGKLDPNFDWVTTAAIRDILMEV